MKLRARDQRYREDMLKTWLEMDEFINCFMKVLDEISLLVWLLNIECFGEKRKHMMEDMLQA